MHMDLSTGTAFVENAMAEHNRLYTDYKYMKEYYTILSVLIRGPTNNPSPLTEIILARLVCVLIIQQQRLINYSTRE